MAGKKGQLLNLSPNNKRSLQGESKKRLILQVATEVFAAKGFNEATISQIAKKANIPEERMDNFLSGLQEHLEGIKGPLSKLRKLIWYHLNFYEKNKDYVLILLQNIQQTPRFNSTRAYQLIREFSKRVVQIIEEGKKEGVLRTDIDSRLLRDAILGAIEHITIRGSILGRLPTLTAEAEALYDVFVSGIQHQ